MGDRITLKIEKRQAHGKKVKALRKTGITPGVVYGAGMEPMAIQAESGEMLRVVYAAGKHSPVQLAGSKRQIAMIKDVDFDPTKHGVVRHVAFHAVNENDPVEAEVPIQLVGEGESPAERAGLIVLQALEKLEIKALPLDLPEKLEVSIEGLVNEGDRVIVRDIKLPEGVEIVERDDGRAEEEGEEKPTVFDLVIASVYEPGALQAANEAAAGEAESADAEQVVADKGEEVAAANEAKDDTAKS